MKARFWALTYGFGVVMTGLHVRNRDPRTEPVQMRLIDPREFRWDPMSMEDDLSDARFCIWSRRVDLVDAQALYPEHSEALARLAKKADDDKKDTDDVIVWEGVPSQPTPPVSKWDEYADQNDIDKDDSIGEARQVTLNELWEIRQEQASLIQYDTGLTVEYDEADPKAAQLLQDPGVVRFYQADVPRVYYHCFSGNLLLKSERSPYKHNRLPFAVCWHERDENGDPVSFIERLKDIQREVNFRRAKAMKTLNNPNIRVSSGLLSRMDLDRDEFAAKFAAGGLIIEGDPGEVEIIRENDLATSQFQWMQDSKQEIQSVSGANDDLMGYDSSSKSGIAKQIVAQQGATMQRPSEAGLRLFDKIVGEQVWQLIQQAHTDAWVVRITDDIGQDKFVSLNQPEIDQTTGQRRILNDISQARCDIEIEDGQWNPTDRERVSTMFAEMAASEQDPLMRQQLRRMAIESADVPKKAKLLEIIDQGIQMMMQQVMPPPPNPEAQQMQQRMAQAEVAKTEAEAADKGASAMQKEQQVLQGNIVLEQQAAMQAMGGLMT